MVLRELEVTFEVDNIEELNVLFLWCSAWPVHLSKEYIVQQNLNVRALNFRFSCIFMLCGPGQNPV